MSFWRTVVFGCCVTSLAVAHEPPRNVGPSLAGLSLEELMEIPVFAASRFEQRSAEAPAYVTVITAEEIRNYGWRDLAELLRSAAGLFTTSDRVYGYVGVRGIAPFGDVNTKILFLIDGHRVNDELYNQGYVREDFLVDLDLVERVEIVRGPGSALYGSNAFLAVVNVVTVHGRDLEGTEVAVETGSFEATRARLTFAKTLAGGADVILSASGRETSGQDLYFPEFDDSATNNGVALGLDGERSYRLFASATVRDFTTMAAFVSRQKEVPTSSYGSIFPDPKGRSDDEAYFFETRWRHDLAGTEVFARLSLDSYRFQSLNTIDDPAYAPEPPHRFELLDSGNHRTASAELKLHRVLRQVHRVTFGAEWREIFHQNQNTFVVDPATTILSAHRPASIWGLYLEDEFRISSALILNAGIRHDHYSTTGGTTNPRLAVIWSPRAATSLKLIYGQAFRAPNAFELYWTDGVTQKDSPNLKPERMRTFELVLEQRLGETLRFRAAGYELLLDDLVSAVEDPQDGLDQFCNTGRVKALGLDLEIEGRWEQGVAGRVAVSLQDPKDESTGQHLANSPRFLAKANLTFPLIQKRAVAGLELLFQSQREPGLPAHTTPAGRSTTVNLTVTVPRLFAGLTLSASIYDLFDSAAADLGGPEHVQELIPQEGRSVRLKAAYRF